jgi:hypothetical protein
MTVHASKGAAPGSIELVVSDATIVTDPGEASRTTGAEVLSTSLGVTMGAARAATETATGTRLANSMKIESARSSCAEISIGIGGPII